jgi:hypothetical protein
MRVAMIVVTLVMATTPLEASQSCMSKAEALQHFQTSYIYWHGADRCWDATPPRQIQSVRRKPSTDEVQRKPDRPKTDKADKTEQADLQKSDSEKSGVEKSVLEKSALEKFASEKFASEKSNPEKSGKDQSSPDQSGWRNSMSAMLPEATASLRAALVARQGGSGDRAAAGPPAPDRETSDEPSAVASRWVDIAQVVPPRILERKPAPAPSVTSGGVVGLFIAFVLTAGIALVFFVPIYQRRRSMTDIWDTP